MNKIQLFIAGIALSFATLFGVHHPFDDPQSFQRYQHKTQDTHYVLGVALDGRCVELEDRTTWTVPSSLAQVVLQWKKGDPVFITPKTSWFGSGEFCYHMRNVRIQNSISTKMATCPDRDGPYTKFVQSIDRYNRRVVLINHYRATFTFNIHPNDLASLDDWEVNDRIFVATNKEWWYNEPSHRMLLINSETLTTARARE